MLFRSGQFFKLNKMPDLAKMIEEYKPQPDPMAQRMQMLEMKKLESEIAERMSRATENATDKRLKEAKAVLEESKAKSLDSDTDLKDLDFLRKSSGEEFEEGIAEKVIDKELAGNTGNPSLLP